MKIYHYDPITREFIEEGLADKDPLVEGNYLIPANATSIEPPEFSDGFVAVFFDNIWSVKIDQRGTIYWLSDGTEKIINSIGETIPEDAYASEDEVPEQPKTDAERLMEIDRRLYEIDIKRSRALSDVILQTADADASRTILQELHDEAESLREERKSLVI